MKTVHKVILIILSILVVITTGWIWYNINDYYLLPISERPHHIAHKMWKPGGMIGHGLGIVGGSMMLIMFVYSIRKRIKFFRKWGKLPTWLNYHIFLGITGPVLVTLHTALKFGGLVSISYWSMVAVALSGFIGRYIYVKIPRRVSGKEVTRDDFKKQLKQKTEQFKEEFGLSDSTVEKIRHLSGADKIRKRGLLGIFTIFFMDITSWLKWQRIKKEISKSSSISRKEMKQFKHSLRQIVKMDRQIAFWHAAQSLFHYWHVIHKPFAYTMIVIMFIHIAVAMSLGYTWKF